MIFKSLKSKIAVSLLAVFLIAIACTGTAIWYIVQQKRLDDYQLIFFRLDQRCSEINALDKDFFVDDSKRATFYLTGTSQNIESRALVVENFNKQIAEIRQSQFTSQIALESDLDSLSVMVMNHEKDFQTLKDLVLTKGYYDYGMIGKMRKEIHQLEALTDKEELESYLSLRRHEKDYLLRGEQKFINRLKTSKDTFQLYLERKEMDVTPLYSYYQFFQNIVMLDKQMGRNVKSGLRARLDQQMDDLFHLLEHVMLKVESHSTTVSNRIQLTLFVIIAFAALLSVVLIFILSSGLGKPVQKLSLAIHNYVKNKFAEKELIPGLFRKDELGAISRDVSFMIGKMASYVSALEKSKEVVMEGIQYARRQQQILLPDAKELEHVFSDHIVLYRPKQIVSGDFYWLRRSEKYIYFAVADCTGHGVPGAFMTALGFNMLNEIVISDEAIKPSDMLHKLDDRIRRTLKQTKNYEQDGIDLMICRIERGGSNQEAEVIISGSKSSMQYQRKSKLIEVKGSKYRLGGARKEKTFEDHKTTLRKGDRLFLFTDGLKDQHNSENLRFGRKQVHEILGLATNWPLGVLQKEIEKRLLVHMQGDVEQRDDITFVALEF